MHCDKIVGKKQTATETAINGLWCSGKQNEAKQDQKISECIVNGARESVTC